MSHSRSSAIGRPRTQRGVSLLEVLIALLVMAIGVLGIAALQSTALRNNQGAMERSQAVILTYSIMDAMRANRAAAMRNDYVRDWGDCSIPGDTSTRASADLKSWMEQIKAFNPDGCGRVQRNGNQFVIGIRWYDRRSGTDDSEPQVLETVGGI